MTDWIWNAKRLVVICLAIVGASLGVAIGFQRRHRAADVELAVPKTVAVEGARQNHVRLLLSGILKEAPIPAAGVRPRLTLSFATSFPPDVEAWSTVDDALIVLPAQSLSAWSDARLKRVLTHEVAHLWWHGIDPGDVAPWLAEGVVEWVAGGPTCEAAVMIGLDLAANQGRAVSRVALMPKTALRAAYAATLVGALVGAGADRPASVGVRRRRVTSRLAQLSAASRGEYRPELEHVWRRQLEEQFALESGLQTCGTIGE